MTFFVTDLASFQERLSVAALRKQGYSGIMVKCTQGTSYVNPDYAKKFKQAKKVFMPFLAYHFLEHGNIEAQVVNLVRNIIDKSIPVMVDFEPAGTRPTWADYTAFLTSAKAAGLKVVLTYYPHFYWQETGNHKLVGKPSLIQALYPLNTGGYGSVVYKASGGDSAKAWQPQGGVVPTFWQFTSRGQIRGYSGNVDIQAFRGTKHELESYFHTWRKPPAKNILRALHYLYLAKRWARAHKKLQRVSRLQKHISPLKHLL